MLKLEAKKREKKNKLEEGLMPAVFYGKVTESTPIAVSLLNFTKVFEEAGESSVVSITGEVGEHDALIHDVQFDVLTGKPIHADFYIFEKGKKLEVEVPLEFEGKSPAVEDMDGILVKVMHELPIEAQPKDLPHDIKVDISALVDLDSVVYAKDLKLPEGVELAVEPDEVICSIALAEEEPEEPEEIDLDSIEVEKKGKEEEAPAEEESTEEKKEEE